MVTSHFSPVGTDLSNNYERLYAKGLPTDAQALRDKRDRARREVGGTAQVQWTFTAQAVPGAKVDTHGQIDTPTIRAALIKIGKLGGTMDAQDYAGALAWA